MKLQVASDLHLEMRRAYQLAEIDSDIIILAGDISTGINGIKFAIQQSQKLNKEVVYICGNHEFYGHDYDELLHEIRALAEPFPCVHFLERDELIINDVRFLGCVLWSDFLGNGDDRQDLNMAIVSASLNDHRLIRNGYRQFSTEDALEQHQLSRNWLTSKLNDDFQGKNVVITHHAPSLLCQHPDFEYSPIATGFLSDMDELVKQAELWIFGHTHANEDITIGKCRLISNQTGYPHENIPVSFNEKLLVEI